MDCLLEVVVARVISNEVCNLFRFAQSVLSNGAPREYVVGIPLLIVLSDGYHKTDHGHECVFFLRPLDFAGILTSLQVRYLGQMSAT